MPAEKISQLGQHEAPIQSPANSNSSELTGQDRIDFKMVQEYYSQGKTARAPYDANWSKRMEFYKGKQWKNTSKKYHSKPVINICRTTIQSILPLLTDAQPGFNVLPQEPGDFDFAESMGTLTESWWNKTIMDQTLLEVLMDSQIYDAGILKVMWDPELEDGLGDVHVDVVSPDDIYVPYGARDFDKDCPWVVHKMKKTVGELKRKFPKFADQIKPDKEGDSSDDDKGDISKQDVTLVSPIDVKATDQTKPPATSKDDRKTVEVYECWADDETVEEYYEESDIDKTDKKFKKSFPNGKMIITLPNQKLVLFSDHSPYKHRKKPFIRFVDAILPREFWGEGEVAPLMDIQKCINKTMANILDYMNFMGNPVWIKEKGNGVDPNRLTNQTGLVIPVNAGKMNTVKRDIPPPLPNYIIEFYNILLRAAEMISGTSDVTQGRRPVGVTSGDAIQELQDAAQTRIRLKERNMKNALSQLGGQVTSLMMQYYRQTRVSRIEGKNDKKPEFVESFISDSEDGGFELSTTKYKYDDERKQYIKPDAPTVSKTTKGAFDVKILSGSSMPFAKAQRSNLAVRLFERGAIDNEELLKTLDWKDYEQVLQRIQENQQAAAKAEAEKQPVQ